MSPTTTRAFYYNGPTKEYEQKVVATFGVGSYSNTISPLYSDEKLTKKVGNAFIYSKIIDNSKQVPVDYNEITIVTLEGAFKYNYIRDSYKKFTADTEETSGIFTKGTVTVTYVPEDNLQSIRKIVYRSAE